MGDPTPPGDYPTLQEAAAKISNGQATEVVTQVGSKLFHDFTAAAKRAGDAVHRTLTATEAPAVPGATQAAYKLATGQAGDVVGDIAKRGLWEAAQVVTHAVQTVKETLGQTTAPVVPTVSQASYKLATGQAGDVMGDIAKRGLWEAAQVVTNTVQTVKETLGQATAPVVPTVSQASYKLATGQAGDVMGDLAKRGLWEAGQFVEHTAETIHQTLNQTTAPVVPTVSQASYKLATGQAGDVMGDLAKRGLWEAGQFVEHTADAVRQTINQPVAPEVMGAKEAASRFITGQGSEVVSNLGGRALWEVGHFASQAYETLNGTGAPAATAPATADATPKEAAKPKPPAGPGSGKP